MLVASGSLSSMAGRSLFPRLDEGLGEYVKRELYFILHRIEWCAQQSSREKRWSSSVRGWCFPRGGVELLSPFSHHRPMSSPPPPAGLVVAPVDVTAADLENLSLDQTPSLNVDQAGDPALTVLPSPNSPPSAPILGAFVPPATAVAAPPTAPSPTRTPHDAPHSSLRKTSSSFASSFRAAVSRGSRESSEADASAVPHVASPKLSQPAGSPPSLHRNTPSLASLNSLIRTAPGVKMILVNQTGLQLEMASWHVRAEDGELCALQSYQGQDLMEHLVPSAGVPLGNQEVVEVGLLCKPEKGVLKNGHTHGWVRLLLSLLCKDRANDSRRSTLTCSFLLHLSTPPTDLTESTAKRSSASRRRALRKRTSVASISTPPKTRLCPLDVSVVSKSFGPRPLDQEFSLDLRVL